MPHYPVRPADEVRVVAEALEAYHEANYRGHDLVYWSTWEQFATVAVEAMRRHIDGAIPGLPNHRLDPEETGDYVSDPLRHKDGSQEGHR